MMKYLYYVGVFTATNQLRFVTNVDNASKTWVYDTKNAPKNFPKSVAEELVEAMCMNFTPAVLVKSPFPITGHPGADTKSEGNQEAV